MNEALPNTIAAARIVDAAFNHLTAGDAATINVFFSKTRQVKSVDSIVAQFAGDPDFDAITWTTWYKLLFRHVTENSAALFTHGQTQEVTAFTARVRLAADESGTDERADLDRAQFEQMMGQVDEGVDIVDANEGGKGRRVKAARLFTAELYHLANLFGEVDRVEAARLDRFQTAGTFDVDVFDAALDRLLGDDATPGEPANVLDALNDDDNVLDALTGTGTDDESTVFDWDQEEMAS